MTHKIDGGLPAVRPPDPSQASAVSRAGSERGQTIAATSAADSVRLTGDAENLQALGRQLGSSPAGVDSERVNAIRAAIADGSYRIDAQQIATRMIELDRQLGK